MTAPDPHGFPRDPWIEQLVRQALAEDIGSGDRSTQVTASPDLRVTAR